MNLSLTPEQFLALYNSLSYHLDSSSPEDHIGWSEVNKIRDLMSESIVESLRRFDSTQNMLKYEAWASREQSRIESLKNELQNLKVHNVSEPDDGLFPRPQRQSTAKKSVKKTG